MPMLRHALTFSNSVFLCAALAVGLAAGQKSGKSGNAAKGKEVFQQCALCHTVDTAEKKMGPSLKGLFKRKTLTNGKPVNDANVIAQINAGGNGMPPYNDILTAEDKANLLAYLHTL